MRALEEANALLAKEVLAAQQARQYLAGLLEGLLPDRDVLRGLSDDELLTMQRSVRQMREAWRALNAVENTRAGK